MHPVTRLQMIALALCLTALLLPVAACSGGPGGGDGPNVLLITLDTTRADRIGAYGHAAGRTPALDRLASTGVLFERAYTPSVLTLPSHASILTGLLPPAHGVRDNGTDRLDPTVTTLAERFTAAGYRTGAFISAAVLEAMYGLDQGFQTYDDATAKDARFTVAYAERNADAVTDAALAWLKEAQGEGPWFLWVHYFDPHTPWKPPAPYDSQFENDPYDGEIAYMDSAIGRLLRAVEGDEPGGGPVIAVAGDHGEGLGDHGEYSHGVFLYEETARVPLIMKGPGLPAGATRVPGIVRTTDIAPTLLELAGLSAMEKGSGESLRALAQEPSSGEERTAYSEAIMPASMYGWSPLASLRKGKWAYIHGPAPELYDVVADPDALSDVVADHADVAAGMHAELERIISGTAADAPPRAASEPDAEQLERLKSLGYVSGSGDDSFRAALASDPLTLLAGGARGMADPKAMADSLLAIERVMRAYGTGMLDQAIPMALFILKDNPENMLVRRYLASAYRNTGQLDLALAEYRKILAAQPRNTDSLIGAGWILMRMDKMEEARAAYREVLAINPRSVDAISSLGSLSLIEGDFQGAKERFQQVLEARPGHIQSMLTLARIAETQGNRDEAMSWLDRALKTDPGNLAATMNRSRMQLQAGDVEAALATLDEAERTNPGRGEVSFGRGNILLQAGRMEEAFEAFRQAVDRAPDVPHGYYGLGLVAQARGESQAARRWFQQALRVAPDFPDARAALQRLGGAPGN